MEKQYPERELERAVNIRQKKDYQTSNALLVTLAEEFPDWAEVHYHCAWSFDLLGMEEKAVSYYEKAISLGLAEEDLEGALLGLGSTYRTLGKYELSKETLLEGIKMFPHNEAMKVFYSMTLYNINEYKKAIEILLTCISSTSNHPDILLYKRAIAFYADKLDRVWK